MITNTTSGALYRMGTPEYLAAERARDVAALARHFIARGVSPSTAKAWAEAETPPVPRFVTYAGKTITNRTEGER